MKLTIIRGLPGSGKSTLAKTLGVFHVEQDMMCMIDGKYQWEGNKVAQRAKDAQNITNMIMSCGCDVVVSNTFTRLWELQPYLDLAKIHNYKVEIWTCTKNYGNVHNVPEESIKKMKNRWEDIPGEIVFNGTLNEGKFI